MSIKIESVIELKKVKRLKKRIKFLVEALQIKSPNGITSICSRIKNKDRLKDLYGQTCFKLDSKYLPERERTISEFECLKRIEDITKTTTLPHIWIGNTLLDIFLPNLSLKDQNGIIRYHANGIEVDGKIHEISGAKTEKDLCKTLVLHDIKIGIIRVNNRDVWDTSYPLPITSSLFYLSSSGTRMRLWQRIYLITVLTHASWDEILNLFEPKHQKLIMKQGEKQ